LLNLGEGAAVEIDVLTQTGAASVDHCTERIDDELGPWEIRRCLGQVHCGDLEQHEDVIAQHGLDRRLTKILDFFGVL